MIDSINTAVQLIHSLPLAFKYAVNFVLFGVFMIGFCFAMWRGESRGWSAGLIWSVLAVLLLSIAVFWHVSSFPSAESI